MGVAAAFQAYRRPLEAVAFLQMHSEGFNRGGFHHSMARRLVGI